MKLERCDRCGQEHEDENATADWTDVEYKGRGGTVNHIRRASYCPHCTETLKRLMYDFNHPAKAV